VPGLFQILEKLIVSACKTSLLRDRQYSEIHAKLNPVDGFENFELIALKQFCLKSYLFEVITALTNRPRGKKMTDIVETAVNAGSFGTLVAALKAASLVDTLKGKGPFTVFAPTDAAFAKLPEGTVDGLLKNIPQLKKILTYHVVSGKVMAAEVTKMKTVKTIEGSEVKIDASNGVKINNAAVTTADVATDNGVIHIIDTVLMPA
jgi:uncharacterized surface protein with fasciclin (FAS1) repeats